MSIAWIIVGFVVLLRLAELLYARRNTKALLERGGLEIGRGHYLLFILLHSCWLVAILTTAPSDVVVHWLPLAIFIVMQALRVWVLLTLGRYWTTRIITMPGMPLVQRGPYRYLRHPNYMIVVGEILTLPLVFGEWQVALVFTALNLMLLSLRIKVEDGVLASRRQLSTPSE